MPHDRIGLGSFDPDRLRTLYGVFDEAWAQLKPETDLALHKQTRNAIATALLQAALNGERDRQKLLQHGMNRARALSRAYWAMPRSSVPAAASAASSSRRTPA